MLSLSSHVLQLFLSYDWSLDLPHLFRTVQGGFLSSRFSSLLQGKVDATITSVHTNSRMSKKGDHTFSIVLYFVTLVTSLPGCSLVI